MLSNICVRQSKLFTFKKIQSKNRNIKKNVMDEDTDNNRGNHHLLHKNYIHRIASMIYKIQG